MSKRPKPFPLDDAIPAFAHTMAPNPNNSLYWGFDALRWANAVIASSKGNNLGVLLTRYLVFQSLLKAHLSLSLGEGKVGFFAAIFFKSPPFPLSLGERERWAFLLQFFSKALN